MRVSAVLPDEGPFEIPKADQITRSSIVAIVCPICKALAWKIEPDVYSCSGCNRLWNVEVE